MDPTERPRSLRWVEGRGKKIAKGLALVKNPGADEKPVSTPSSQDARMGFAAFWGWSAP